MKSDNNTIGPLKKRPAREEAQPPRIHIPTAPQLQAQQLQAPQLQIQQLQAKLQTQQIQIQQLQIQQLQIQQLQTQQLQTQQLQTQQLQIQQLQVAQQLQPLESPTLQLTAQSKKTVLLDKGSNNDEAYKEYLAIVGKHAPQYLKLRDNDKQQLADEITTDLKNKFNFIHNNQPISDENLRQRVLNVLWYSSTEIKNKTSKPQPKTRTEIPATKNKTSVSQLKTRTPATAGKLHIIMASDSASSYNKTNIQYREFVENYLKNSSYNITNHADGNKYIMESECAKIILAKLTESNFEFVHKTPDGKEFVSTEEEALNKIVYFIKRYKKKVKSSAPESQTKKQTTSNENTSFHLDYGSDGGGKPKAK